jgi:hypothetical protein
MRNVTYGVIILLLAAGAVTVAQKTRPVPEKVPVVPEMADILGGTEETRLLATRRLAERVGVEEALEILEHSSLPHTGEGHLAVHQIGFYAYQTFGPQAILKCKDYFLYACYHGAIIEAASDKGLTTVGKMADLCKESASRYFQCAHAVGHAVLAMWNYDLPAALADCDKLFAKETRFPEAQSSCHNGVFMENLFGVHDWGKGTTALKRKWLSEDPYYPCNAVAEKYQKGCWLNQASRIYTLEKGNIAKTRERCERAGMAQYTEWCMDNLARQIHPSTAGSVDKVFALCDQVGPRWKQQCVWVNAGSYASVGDPATGRAICERLETPEREKCLEKVNSIKR